MPHSGPNLPAVFSRSVRGLVRICEHRVKERHGPRGRGLSTGQWVQVGELIAVGLTVGGPAACRHFGGQAINIKVNTRALFKNINLEEIKFDKKFDLIVSNPPYLPDVSLKNLNLDIKLYEPKIALQGGVQGVDFLYKIIDLASKILKINGLLALEIGDNQFHILAKYLKIKRFKILDKYILINKQVRCLLATKL